MKSHPFTRPTIVEAVEFLGETLTQAKFDQLAIRLELDDEIHQAPGESVAAKSALLARLVNQRATQVVSTLDGPVTLAEAAVREAVQIFSDIYHLDESKPTLDHVRRFSTLRILMSESLTTSHTTDGHNSHRAKQPIRCPACGSCSIHTKNHAQKIGGTLGAGMGVVSSLSGSVQGASSGAALAFHFTSSTHPLTRISATVLGALVGGAIGCATGAAFGQVIDDTILNNYRCLRCHHSFQTS